MVEQITGIFCDIEDFCEEYRKYCTKHLLKDEKHMIPKTSMEMCEIMTIVVYFHLSQHRTFKWYYKDFVCKYLREYFPKLVSYNRFVEIMQWVSVPLTLYLTKYRFGKCTGVSFIDSTSLDVCDNHRISTHKVFKAAAKRGKSSMGWFYVFKLHIVINHHGELLAFCLTSGNIDDRNMAVLSMLTKEVFGKLYADRGYISQSSFLSSQLFFPTTRCLTTFSLMVSLW